MLFVNYNFQSNLNYIRINCKKISLKNNFVKSTDID